MIDLKQWLAGLGLADHAKTFSANGIGRDAVSDHIDADLKELGLNRQGYSPDRISHPAPPARQLEGTIAAATKS